MSLKNFNQFITESKKTAGTFQPKYFDLPYAIPEDRFSGGLLKNNRTRRTSTTREILQKNSKYKSKEEFLAKNSFASIEKKVLAEINRVIKFISNNPLTGKKVKADFSQESSLEEYLSVVESGEDVLFGVIGTNLPFSQFSIRVDYDIYKDVPVFTFWYDGDLFYYYGVFTLEVNDVIGAGEFHTYITADEMIEYLFYETVWRDAIRESMYIDIDLSPIGISEEQLEELQEIVNEDPNYAKPIVSNYFSKKFIKFLGSWIEEGEPPQPTSKTSNRIIFPDIGNYVRIPYSNNNVAPAKYVNQFSHQTTILITIEEGRYHAIRLLHNPEMTKISSILTGEYVTQNGWDAVDWKPMSSEEVKKLFFINNKGKSVWFTDFMHS